MAENAPVERKKSRWRPKLFDKSPEDTPAEEKTSEKAQLNEDVMDFLKPSGTKTQTHALPKAPRIDVAAAPRWPGASDLTPSPGLQSSMRGRDKRPGRKQDLSVAFVRTAPEIIGEGGDEAEEAAIEVSIRRMAAARAQGRNPFATQDDAELGLRTPIDNVISQGSQALSMEPSLRRSKTTQAPPSSLPFQRTGTGSLEQGAPSRSPTFAGNVPPPPPRVFTDVIPRPASRTTDEADFVPPPIRRTQTGLTSPKPIEERKNRIPELSKPTGDDSPINVHQELEDFLETGPADPSSFSARVQHKMRVEEGRALHDAVRNRASLLVEDDSSRPSTSGSISRVPVPNAERFAEPRRSTSSSRPDHGSHTQARREPESNLKPLPSPSFAPQGYGSSPHLSHSRNPSASSSPPTHAPAGYFPPARERDSPTKSSMLRNEYDSIVYPSPLPSPRMDASSGNDEVLEDFATRVTHMQGILRLTAELEGPLFEYKPMKWLRAAVWWFLRGRAGVETMMRNRPRGEGVQQLLTQAHVDLAKTWWILYEVITNHPALKKYGDGPFRAQIAFAREAGDQHTSEINDIAETVASSLKGLLASMSRNDIMPPHSSLVQGQDQTIWIKYPKFAPDAQAILSGKARSLTVEGPTRDVNPLRLMPLTDTPQEFSFGRMFVQASLSTDDAETDRVQIPCMLSITRSPNDIQVKLAICSQTDLVNICVQGDRKLGPTWQDVQWKTRSRGMYIQLPRGFTLSMEFSEKDFRTLWGIDDYTRKIESSLQPSEDERFIFEVALREIRYSDSKSPPAFPPDRVRRCSVRVFERVLVRREGTGERRLHRGYRLLIVTSPKNKTLSSVSHEFGTGRPMNFEYRTDNVGGDAAPALVLRIQEDNGRRVSTSLAFHDPSERNQLYSILNGMNMGPEETPWAHVALKSLLVEQADQAEGFGQSGRSVFGRLQWSDVKVINHAPRSSSTVGDHRGTVLSDSLRIIARHNGGSLTDRLNLRPGELSIRLDVSGSADISLLRTPQEDVAMSVDAKRIESGVPEALEEVTRAMMTAQTVRTFGFRTLQDLHAFEAAVTGFMVKYDGVAASFAIARRRMVVPIYKRWEATSVRLQIVQQESVVQLLAFFEDYSHADAMGFQLKSMDVFEKVEKGGKPGVKLVDAKFFLPPEKDKGKPVELGRRFVCLDMPEYAGEHDDITVGFDTDAERDSFTKALPAATQLGRNHTFKRRI